MIVTPVPGKRSIMVGGRLPSQALCKSVPSRARTPSSRKNPGRFAEKITTVFQLVKFHNLLLFMLWHDLQKRFARIAFFRTRIQDIKRGWVAPLRVRGLKQRGGAGAPDVDRSHPCGCVD